MRESGFSDVSKAKVDEVQKQLHKEDMGEKKSKKRRDGTQKLCDENSKTAERLKSVNRTETGRPHVEINQPDILSAIVNIVGASSATDDRRHSEPLTISKVS